MGAVAVAAPVSSTRPERLMLNHEADLSAVSDADLVQAARDGQSMAYAELWRRYASSGRAAARSFTTSYDPDDLVSEAFVRILRSIRNGGGPTTAFRAYLVTTIRNVAISWHRAKTADSLEDADLLPDPTTEDAAVMTTIDKGLVAEAFSALPERWQQVLWYSEMEGLKPRQIAPLLEMTANSVSALAVRAREGLRNAWIQAHVGKADVSPEHAQTIGNLGAYTRGKLGKRETAAVEKHLASCASCTLVASEANRVASVLPWALLPLIGGSTIASWFAAPAPASAHTIPERHNRTVILLAALALVVIGAGTYAVDAITGAPSTPAASRTVGDDGETGTTRPTEPVRTSAPTPAPTPSPSPSPSNAPSTPGTTPSADPGPDSGEALAPVISSIDTGAGAQAGLWYPIVSGTATPGATVTVSNGDGAPASVIAGSDGVWLTGQLTGFRDGAGEVTASQITPEGIQSAVTSGTFSLSAPAVQTTITGAPPGADGTARFTVTASGPARSTVQVSTTGAGSWDIVTTADGRFRWEQQYSWGEPGSRTVLFRNTSGERFGPPRAATITVP